MRHTTRTLVGLFLVSSAIAQTWRQAHPGASPPAREGHSLAWDSGRQRAVLFGGYEWGLDRHYGDHWEYDGAAWTQRTLGTGPSPRLRAGMCYDERRGVIVLFGGLRNSTFGSPVFFGDTWEFDGSSWRQVSPVGATPSARFAELAYDSARGVVVLFGGYGATAPGLRNDTWEYDGTRWLERTPATSPPARPDYAVAFDRRRSKLVAQPGYVLGHSTQMITWEWDGNDWAPAANTTLLPPFSQPSMTYDTRRECVVLVGATFSAAQQTWEYDGTDWRRNDRAPAPNVGLHGHKLTCDETRGAVVMFGGEKISGPYVVATNETWEYATYASYEVFGTSCAAAGLLPRLAAQAGSVPRTGSTLFSEVTNLTPGDLIVMLIGTDRSSWAGLPLPLDLGVIGLPGCKLFTSIDVAVPVTNQGGAAPWSLAIPADPQLHGGTLYNQALVLDPLLGPGSVTNGAIVTIGL